MSFSSFNCARTSSSAASWRGSGCGKTIMTGSNVAGNFFIISASVLAAGNISGFQRSGRDVKAETPPWHDAENRCR